MRSECRGDEIQAAENRVLLIFSVPPAAANCPHQQEKLHWPWARDWPFGFHIGKIRDPLGVLFGLQLNIVAHGGLGPVDIVRANHCALAMNSAVSTFPARFTCTKMRYSPALGKP